MSFPLYRQDSSLVSMFFESCGVRDGKRPRYGAHSHIRCGNIRAHGSPSSKADVAQIARGCGRLTELEMELDTLKYLGRCWTNDH
jgi:hypothetical protein